nr:MAG TPA: hypothetical protein [Caudoviricetes sp.]
MRGILVIELKTQTIADIPPRKICGLFFIPFGRGCEDISK